jgi:virginiamycin B lyase
MDAGKIAKITPAGAITEFSLPASDQHGPDQIALGPDRNLWFTDSTASQIGRITPSGRITEIPTPTDQTLPEGITAGPRSTIWFTESSGNSIGCARC